MYIPLLLLINLYIYSPYQSIITVSKAKIEACMSDYQFLCNKYNKMNDIIKCFHTNWDKVSPKCKETK